MARIMMKKMTTEVHGFEMEDIDYQSPIEVLSHEPHYPLSMHLRNHLLAPYSAQQRPLNASEQDPWTTYVKYRRGAQFIAIGDVPLSIQKGANHAIIPNKVGLWGIAILFPAATSIGEREQEKEMGLHIWNSMRLMLWLSSETISQDDKVSIDHIRSATKDEESLLHYLLKQFVVESIHRLYQQHRHIPSINDNAHPVDLFAVNEAWVRVIRRWTEEGDACIRLTRANPCMTFLKSEADIQSDVAVPSRWQVGVIESKKELEMVQNANSLRFPFQYLVERKHISVLIRDGKGDDKDEDYPASIHKGSPAAWAYAHDDLSLASLHVAEPYRRLKLGQLCVNLMGKKLIQAQQQALLQAGSSKFHHSTTPFLLDTEMHKGASRLFFESQGFQGIVVATWGSILVTSRTPLTRTNLSLSSDD